MLETELFEGYLRIPATLIADHRIEDREQLPHAGDVGDLGRLSSVT